MDLDKLRELIQIFEDAAIAEMEIEEEGSRILLKKSASGPVMMAPLPATPAVYPAFEGSSTAPRANGPASQKASQNVAEGEPKEALEEGLVLINSPMVGVFYAAPAPGEAPFVQPGDHVEAGQTVCIVEAMKLMNEVTAKFACTIEKVLVENAEPVEFGQPLFAVRPIE